MAGTVHPQQWYFAPAGTPSSAPGPKAKGFSELLSLLLEARVTSQQFTLSFSLSSELWKLAVRPSLCMEMHPPVRPVPLWWTDCLQLPLRFLYTQLQLAAELRSGLSCTCMKQHTKKYAGE